MSKLVNLLQVKDLKVSINPEDSGAPIKILDGLNISLVGGLVHALMGPNGSGKSTLAQTLMGHPKLNIDSGEILFAGKNVLDLEPNERAGLGIFLSFQYPSEIPGVRISSYLRLLHNKRFNEKLTPSKFRKHLTEKMEILDMKEEFMDRYLNEGFSGGEKKRMEMLQMLVLEPKLAVLDETDSGLDVDALKVVSKAVNYLVEKNQMTVLLITHYTRILKYIQPHKVFILQAGKIVKEGSEELAHELEEKGYAPWEKNK